LDELQAGDPRQVGTYTLLARIGSGGMGQVYFGRSLGGRHVAVKVIRGDLAQDQSFRARFAREVQAARRVSGAFTAPVIDADPDAPVPWLVTDYVHGPSLGDAVARHGPLPLPALLTLAARLAEGLGAVHAAGVIHRDLKPANVLLAEDGPRLIDFGISQAADFAQITSPTSVLGTPGFIAPELIQGEPVGPASDIFTLGAVLAYAATGEFPFGVGPADARTLRVLYLAPDLGSVPAPLRPLLERCLAKVPAERPTAGEFLADLVAACPEAADDREDWLPDGILAEIRQRPLPEEVATSRLRVTAPPPAMTQAPARRFPWRKWTERPRFWATGGAAAAAAIAAVIGLLVAPSGGPSGQSGRLASAVLAPPTGLTALQETETSVTLNWNLPPGGARPDSYEILENGKELVSVSGNTSTYQVTGLSTNTAYQFSVVAVASASRSAPSVAILAATTAQSPLDEVVFDGTVTARETVSSDSYWQKVGTTWTDTWYITANCGPRACATAALSGAVNGIDFTATLTRSGATYTGVAPIDDFWLDCLHQSNHEDTTLDIKLVATRQELHADSLTVSAFTGTMTWNVPALPDGCNGSLYQMRVSGTSQ
jgi:hypothetical protein